MKKTYITPENIVVAINSNATLLAGSIEAKVLNPSEEFSGGSDDIGAHESDFDF
jgi:hypothetical protein